MLNLTPAALTGGLGLEGIAAAMLLGRMADWPALLGRTLLPLVWCAAVVGVLGRLAPIEDAISALATLVAYALALLPLARISHSG